MQDRVHTEDIISMVYNFTIFDIPIGTKVEGILRQSADVEEVERRVQEYEQGIYCIQVLTICFIDDGNLFGFACWIVRLP